MFQTEVLLDGQLTRTAFQSGLVILTERLPYFQSVSLGVGLKVGTRDESLECSGVCHFLEHMLFKGTHQRSALEIAQQVDQMGGEFNAFTSREHTCFHLLLLKKYLKRGASLLSDVLMNSVLDPVEMERERKIILQEIAMVSDTPEEWVHDLFFEKVYQNQGLGRPILGTLSSVQTLSRGALVDFFKAYYQAPNLVIAAVGDIEHQQLLDEFEDLIDYCDRQQKQFKNSFEIYEREAPTLFHSGSWWIHRPLEQVQVVLGVESPPCHSVQRFAALLLNNYLGGGMSSLLFQEIREKHALAYTVYSTLSPFLDSGVLSLYAGIPKKHSLLCLQLMQACLEKVASDLLTEEQLGGVKEQVKGLILLAGDQIESRMFSLIKNEIFLKIPLNLPGLCQKIDAVTAEEVRLLAEQLFRKKRSLVVMGPKASRQTLKSLESYWGSRIHLE